MIPITIRFYSSTAPEVTLTAGVNNVDGVIVVSSTTGFPLTTPYTLALDYGGATEELVEVTGVAGTSLTITRGIDGTSAASHGAGAKVRHVTSARDFKDSRDHENASTNVHGLSGGAAVVGDTNIQTLSNKTLDTPTLDGTVTATGDVNIAGNVDIPTGTLTVGTAPGFGGDTTINGSFIAQGGAVISTTSGVGVHLEVEKETGSTGLLQRWSGVGGVDTLASVDGDGNGSFARSSLSGASLFSVGAGWTISNAIAVSTAGIITLNIVVQRTGANIVASATGDIADSTIGTITAAWRPNSTFTASDFSVMAQNSIGSGGANINPGTGVLLLRSWNSGATISTGNLVAFTASYVS